MEQLIGSKTLFDQGIERTGLGFTKALTGTDGAGY